MTDVRIFFTMGLLLGLWLGYKAGYAAAVRHNGRVGLSSSWRRLLSSSRRRLRSGRW